MKPTLDELKVESYSTQVSEKELTEIKGGTTYWCINLGTWVASQISFGGSSSTTQSVTQTSQTSVSQTGSSTTTTTTSGTSTTTTSTSSSSWGWGG